MIEHEGKVLFTRAELECKCGCGRADIEPAFMEKLKDLRITYNRPIFINSGYRCPDYNERVSFTGRTGPHTIGAVDISVSGKDAHRLLHMAFLVGFTGIGVKQKGSMAGRFIHLDNLTIHNNPRPGVWTY
jgi:zinc D-Ala-D-Ala carboxypeptidase